MDSNRSRRTTGVAGPEGRAPAQGLAVTGHRQDGWVPDRRLEPVPERPPAVRFAECVRTVGAVARAGRLKVPVVLSPPRRPDVDRSIRRRGGSSDVVAIRITDRPFVAVQNDVIDGFIAANRLDIASADRFRRDAWDALDGRPRRRRREPSVAALPERASEVA